MPTSIALSAAPRDLSKTPRALRREGVVPGVLYGHLFEATSLQFGYQALERVVSQAGFSHFLTVDVAGVPQDALLRDVQRDPVSGRILHVDLYRVVADELLRSTVPLELVGVAPALELGGMLNQLLESLDVECFPRDLPESIAVDVSVLADVHAHISVSDLVVPEGVTVLNDPDEAVVQVTVQRGGAEAEEEGEAEAGEE